MHRFFTLSSLLFGCRIRYLKMIVKNELYLISWDGVLFAFIARMKYEQF